MEKEIIKIQAGMSDPKGKLIPRGIQEKITIQIRDEVAACWFNNPNTTRKWGLLIMELEKRRGANDTIFIERMQKIVTKYEGKTKEQIRDIILKELKQFGLNLKNVR